MKRYALFFFLLCSYLSGFGQSSINLASRIIQTSLYVSNSGSSTNNGSTPALAITPAKLITLTLQQGQTVYFNRGESFSSFELTGILSKIAFDAYGTGTYPILYGSTSLSGATWTSIGGNVYTTPVSSPALWMYQNEVEAPLAETPWYAITSQSSSTVITATSLIGAWGSTIVGAKIVIKEYYFAYSHVMTVTNFNSGTGQITLSSPVQTGLTGFSFKLFDQQQFLSAGEWWYNTSDGKIYYQTASGSPSSSTWRYTTKNTAFTLADGSSDVSFQHLDLRQYYVSAIRGKSNPRTTIRNNTISQIRQNGIFLYGVNDHSDLSYNTITYCAQNALYLGGLTDQTISYNTIRKIGLQASLPFILKMGTNIFSWEQSTGSGIVYTRDSTTSNIVSLRSTITRNNIDSVSYLPISGLGSYHSVTYNEVSYYQLKFLDGGGIYFIKAFGYDPSCDYNTISKNIIHDAIGTQEYTPGLFSNNVFGIHLDVNSSHFTIDNNVIYNIPGAGIHANYGCFANTITNNIIVGTPVGVIFHNNVTGSYVANVGNILSQNVFGMRSNTQIAVLAEDYNGSTSYNPFSSSGISNINYYLNPYTTSLFAYASAVNGSRTSQTFAQWQTHIGQDVDSKTTAVSYTYTNSTNALNEMRLLVNRSDYTGRAYSEANYVNIDGSYTYRETIPAFGGLALIQNVSSGSASVTDNFTGTNGTAIASHAPDVGGTWVLHSGTATLNGSGFLTASSVADITQNLTSADPIIAITGKVVTSGFGLDIIARHNGATSGYANETFIRVAWYGTGLTLIARSGGVDTTVGTATTATQTVGTEYTMTLTLVGNNAQVVITGMNGGSPYINVTDVALNLNSTSTRHGLRLAGSGNALINSISITH